MIEWKSSFELIDQKAWRLVNYKWPPPWWRQWKGPCFRNEESDMVVLVDILLLFSIYFCNQSLNLCKPWTNNNNNCFDKIPLLLKGWPLVLFFRFEGWPVLSFGGNSSHLLVLKADAFTKTCKCNKIPTMDSFGSRKADESSTLAKRHG